MFQTVSDSGKASIAREEALLLITTFKGLVARDGISDIQPYLEVFFIFAKNCPALI
jgi:hypothetical protein